MISAQRLDASGKNKNGDAVVDYLLAVEYYTNAEGQAEETTRWGGKLANDPQLGLAGKKVMKEDMLKLAEGFAPDGTALCRNAGAKPKEVVKLDRNGNPRLDKEGNPITKMEGGHRVGFDFTVSAPKPVSVAFAIAEPDEKDRILQAHRDAVAEAMEYLESMVETRRGAGGKDVIGTRGLVYMQADHLASRDMDMNIHTHNLIFGVTQGEDEKWGTFDARELYRHRQAADVIYKNQLAANMRELGYAAHAERELNDDQEETGQVHWKIAGISDELCETFSKRRVAILEYQEKFGVSAQEANLATRRHKDEPTYAEMLDIWKKTMDAMEAGAVPTTQELKSQTALEMEPKSFEEILEDLHENEAVICEHHLVHKLGMEYATKVDARELMNLVEDFKRSEGLVHVKPERIAEEDKGKKLGRIHTETRYAAPWMRDWEQEIVHRVESRKEETTHQVPVEVVEKTMADYEKRKGFSLSKEQRASIMNLTHESGGVGILEGFAGTGKTTVSDCYQAAFKAQGKRMMGVAVSNAAAQKLEEESGMPSMSVSKMIGRLERNKMAFTSRDVLVVDEAGMIDTNQTRRLLSHAHKGGAKVILQGDIYQLQPIGAGSGMSLAKKAEKSTKLTEVYRQSRVEDRETAMAFYQRDADGNHVEVERGGRSRQDTLAMGKGIMARLKANNQIDDFDNQKQAIDALVNDYFANPKPVDEKLVLGHARVEVKALNEAIREGLKKEGVIAKDDTRVRVKENGYWSEIGLAKGDRVRFTLADSQLGVINGSQGVLESVKKGEEGGMDIAVRLQSSREDDNGRVVRFNTDDYHHLAHNLATTVHKSQGQGKEEIFHLANHAMMDNHSTLVAFTRLTKGEYRLYGTTEDIERLGERLGMERMKTTVLGEGLNDEPAVENEPANIVQQILAAQAKKQEHAEKVAEQSSVTPEDLAFLKEASGAFLRKQLEQRREQQQQKKQEQGHSL